MNWLLLIDPDRQQPGRPKQVLAAADQSAPRRREEWAEQRETVTPGSDQSESRKDAESDVIPRERRPRQQLQGCVSVHTAAQVQEELCVVTVTGLMLASLSVRR